MLSACEQSGAVEESVSVNTSSAISSEGESIPEESSEDFSEDASEDETYGENNIKVLYNSYSEKPYFAMVGTCTEGAVVTAECSG